MTSVERYPARHNRKITSSKITAGALGASVLAAIGIHAVDENRQPQPPIVSELHKEFEVRPGDTISELLQRAFPEQDWRILMSEGYIENQLPAADREDHILRPGEIIIFGTDSKIGQLVDPSKQENSVGES